MQHPHDPALGGVAVQRCAAAVEPEPVRLWLAPARQHPEVVVERVVLLHHADDVVERQRVGRRPGGPGGVRQRVRLAEPSAAARASQARSGRASPTAACPRGLQHPSSRIAVVALRLTPPRSRGACGRPRSAAGTSPRTRRGTRPARLARLGNARLAQRRGQRPVPGGDGDLIDDVDDRRPLLGVQRRSAGQISAVRARGRRQRDRRDGDLMLGARRRHPVGDRQVDRRNSPSASRIGAVKTGPGRFGSRPGRRRSARSRRPCRAGTGRRSRATRPRRRTRRAGVFAPIGSPGSTRASSIPISSGAHSIAKPSARDQPPASRS